MPAPIVEQLLNGLKVQCADGTVVSCRPLPLGDAMAILDCWDQLADKTLTDKIRAAARITICRRFAKTYPQLADHISTGDVETLVPGFFWGRTGASVMSEAPATGTPSGGNISPSGETSPKVGNPPQHTSSGCSGWRISHRWVQSSPSYSRSHS